MATTPPQNPITSTYWDEPNSDSTINNSFSYNGTLWLSRSLYQRDICLSFGQNISILGLVIGQISSDTSDVPIVTGSQYHLYLKRFTVSFSTSGTLSSSNYWKLQFKSGASVVQSLNVASGNNAEVTGIVVKTSPDINTLYSYTGRYAANLTKVGSAPTIINPILQIEYQLNYPG